MFGDLKGSAVVGDGLGYRLVEVGPGRNRRASLSDDFADHRQNIMLPACPVPPPGHQSAPAGDQPGGFVRVKPWALACLEQDRSVSGGAPFRPIVHALARTPFNIINNNISSN